MPVYNYSGIDATGKKVRGVMDADNPRLLRDNLKAQGIFLTDHQEGSKGKGKSGGGKSGELTVHMPWENRIPTNAVAIMTRQLATLTKAGIPLVDALGALVEQTEVDALKRVISDIRQRVNEGDPLADALKDHPKVFSPLYINMIRAAETSGTMDVVLIRLSDFLEDQAEMRGQLISALTYPVAMLVITIGIIAFLMASVVPQLTELFADQGESLPPLTLILIWTSSFFGRFWWLVGIGLFGGYRLFKRWHSSPAGRLTVDTWLLKLPVIGSLIRMIAVSRFSKTLGTTLSSGVPLLEALDIVKNILGNTVLIDVVEKARHSIREGESIADPLSRSGQFPPMVVHMIKVGERTGEIEAMLDNVSSAYDREVSMKIGALTGLLQPIIIILMGVGVGGIVGAIILPILQLNASVV